MKRSTLLILAIALCSAVSAQRIKLLEGDIKPLQGQTIFKTEFTYDNMTVGKDKSEQDYIAERKAKMNGKEAGRGDSWEKAWVSDRTERFEPQFRELFSKYSGISTVGEKNTPYTLIFKTTRTEPGWNVGVMRVPAFIDGEAWIVETRNPSNVIARISVLNAPGRDAMGFDYETGARLQEAYAKAGKSLGNFFKKQLK
jgi:hypothetical protein